MPELFTKIHDIQDNAVSKHFVNTAFILAYLFISPSKQCCEVWASQFPFLHNLKDTIPTSDPYFYGLH